MSDVDEVHSPLHVQRDNATTGVRIIPFSRRVSSLYLVIDRPALLLLL
jgi:hypothetical protein